MNFYFGTRHTAVDLSRVVSMNQIHSGTVKYVTENNVGTRIPECDGIVTDRKNVALAVKTADCVPLLMHTDNVITAVHAGWRGTIQNIAVNAVKLMMDYGANVNNIKIAVGPSICFNCYEVKDDFVQAVESIIGKTEFVRNGHADIAGINIKLLTDFGVPRENIEFSNICTCCNQNLYFSYRGSGGKPDCMYHVIEL